MRRVRLPDGTLNHFTAAAGVEIYRGDSLPSDLVGDLFFNEPVARIVRRAKVVVTDGLTQLRNAYPKSEFIRSTDPLFRPVSISNAPDGTLYLVDMYTGIIQDAQFVAPESVPAQEGRSVRARQAAQLGPHVADHARQQGRPIVKRPRMYDESAAQLVEHLEHPNGWWRDTAQKLLVLRQDKSVVPALRTMARGVSEPARPHPRDVDARRAGRARREARARVDEEPRPADPHPGDSCERDALQGRRQVLRRGLPRDGRRTPIPTSSSRRC